MIVLRVGAQARDAESQIEAWRRSIPSGFPIRAEHGEDWVGIASGPHAHLSRGDVGPVVFEGTLHYRNDLRQALGGVASSASDGGLATAAVTNWSGEAPRRLEGSWGLAWWDETRRVLRFTPDHVGNVPLFHARIEGGYVVASSLPLLLATAGVSLALDATAIALMALGTTHPSRTAWFGVETAPAGRLTTWSPRSDLQVTSWWNPPDHPPSTRTTLADRMEVARETWSNAVDECIGEGTKLGIFLSSGLDSTIVAGWSAPKLQSRGESLVAFTESPHPKLSINPRPGRNVDEWDLANEFTRGHSNIRHERIWSGDPFLPETLRWIHERFDTPLRNSPNFGWIRAGYERAHELGLQKMLWGGRGNATLSFRTDPTIARGELLFARRFRDWVANRRRPFGLRDLASQLRAGLFPSRYFSEIGRLQALRAIDAARTKPLSGDLIADVVAQLGEFVGGKIQSRRAFFQGGASGFSAEIGGHLGISNADPCADRRFAEVCLSLPFSDHLEAGKNRALARRLGQGILPKAVLDAPARGMQGAELSAMLNHDRDRYARLWRRVREVRNLGGILDVPRLDSILDSCISTNADDPQCLLLIRCIDIALFLEHVETKFGEVPLAYSSGTERDAT